MNSLYLRLIQCHFVKSVLRHNVANNISHQLEEYDPSRDTPDNTNRINISPNILTRIWANAQRDGRPAEYLSLIHISEPTRPY